MQPERWQQIEQLYHAAQKHDASERETFLEEACAGDEALRHEVQSLLGYQPSAEDFLDGPALHAAAKELAQGKAVLKVDQALGSYKILDRLGAGGMGEVYRARDTKLGREVALKVLPEVFAHDQVRLARFQREARLLASLNHPNVAVIHGLEESDGMQFLVLELVQGNTLADRLKKGPMPVSEALEVCRQIAEGLEAAHEQGIIHRDLKPANIKITPEGKAKVLDFGLAKAYADKAASTELTRSQSGTEAGVILGTAAYMSPEQARGQPMDKRTDIWAFGCVLYECLVGERPFEGETVTDILSAIIDKEPDWSRLPATTPAQIRTLLRRCLQKDTANRLHDIADARVEIDDVLADSRGAVHQKMKSLTRPGLTWVLACLVLGIGIGLTLWNLKPETWSFRGPSPEPPAPRMTVVPLTTFPGHEFFPAISPDGNYVTFTRRGESGVPNLYVRQIGGETLLISSSSRPVFSPAWSPDSQEIAFIRQVDGDKDAPRDGIFRIPSMGGKERHVGTFRSNRRGLSWSPDGKFLAIPLLETTIPPSSIFLISVETSEKRKLTTVPPENLVGDWYPRFSPDGGTLAFLRGGVGVGDIYLVSVDSGEERLLTSGHATVTGLDWAPDGMSIVFSAIGKGRAGVWSLWRVSVSGGKPEPLEAVDQGTFPTVSRAQGRLTYRRLEGKSDIWRARGPSAGEDIQDPPEPFISSSRDDFYPRYSPDGKKVSFSSARSGYQEIWICDSDGSNPQQLTFFEHPMTYGGNWSPDGQQIVFFSAKAKEEKYSDIYIVNATMGGLPRRLTTDPGIETSPTWSSDGRWIYFCADWSGTYEIWKLPIDGGKAIQFTKNLGVAGAESVDDGFFYFGKHHNNGGIPGIWRMPIEGGEEEQVLNDLRFMTWTLYEQGIIYLTRESIERFDLVTGEVSTVAELEDRPRHWSLSVSPDSRWITYVVKESESDIFLVENFQ